MTETGETDTCAPRTGLDMEAAPPGAHTTGLPQEAGLLTKNQLVP